VASRIVVEAADDLGVHLGDPLRRALEAVAVGVLADREEQLADGRGEARLVDRRGWRPLIELFGGCGPYRVVAVGHVAPLGAQTVPFRHG
jgi:hypothetical protein